jgi:hypothetical protein
MFNLPVSETMILEGLSKEHPIHLDGIKCSNFNLLLRFMNTRFVVFLGREYHG